MPTLGEVMRSEIGEERFRATGAFALRDERVTAMKLATGAPCAGHGAMFAPWPGPEPDVERWYLLESGQAVGIAGAQGGAPRLRLCETGASRAESTQAVMDRPHSPRVGPYPVMVEEGRTYRWCSCGLSAGQPWCDDSHLGTGFEPIEFVAPITAEFYMCGCKGSDNKPYCFGNCTGHGTRAAGS